MARLTKRQTEELRQIMRAISNALNEPVDVNAFRQIDNECDKLSSFIVRNCYQPK